MGHLPHYPGQDNCGHAGHQLGGKTKMVTEKEFSVKTRSNGDICNNIDINGAFTG